MQARAVDAGGRRATSPGVTPRWLRPGDAPRSASLQKARVRELLRQVQLGLGDVASTRDAKRLAEECRAAAEQAQLLQLEEGQETNVKLAQIARLHAVGVEQKNADLKRELAEQQARRQGLTGGARRAQPASVSASGAGGLGF